MKLLGWTGTVLKYMAGVLCWLLVLGLLQNYCVFDIYSVVDGLWVKELNGDLVENATGEIAYRRNWSECGDTYIYTVEYHPADLAEKGERRSLTSMVDVATWEYVGWESITLTYQDSRYTYVLYTISDGDFMKAVDR